ncbi:Target SNARE coiled-coil homology domain [Arabidopsis suecica]|uniref:Target SNARE coiled-coil homology domain n=1 Tax=Arabidopsis suecica TaxID=45249 RepID=A0A8T2CHZ1_ARASU|nr:Target SNARE coiled-coil homology domain [Arabidopsis suecica]
MASSLDSWKREHNEALKLSEEIDEMILERSSLAETESYALRHASSMRRKITILATRVETLQYLVAKSPGKPISAKEMSRRKGMVEDLRSKANQMASALDMLKFSNIDSLLRPEKQDDIMSRVIGMDNQGIVGLQRQVMKEQDEELEKLEATVMSVKHIALALNEELGLQKKLIDGLDHNVDVSASGVKKVQKRVDTGVCMSLLLSVLEVIGLADLIFSNPSDKVQEPRKD